MSGGTALAVALTLAAGLAGAVQIAVMGTFGERIGVLEALAFSALVTVVLAASVLLVARQSLGGFAAGAREPAWLWLGGVMSAFIVLSITVAGPRIGAAATTGVFIAAQLVLAVLIDRFGLFGVARIALDWPRVLGIALLVLGAALSLRRS